MREILFRGKGNRKYNSGGWYHGYLSKDCDGDYVITEIGFSRTVIPSTVGQYTGLKDKNGKRIFEGDILLSCHIADSPAIEVVKWIYNGWHTQEGDLTPDMIDDVGIMPYSEVIGNVHDNPELLKGE